MPRRFQYNVLLRLEVPVLFHVVLLLLARGARDHLVAADEARVGEPVHADRLVLEVLSALDPALVHVHAPQHADRDGAEREQKGERHVGVARVLDDGRRHERADE